LSHPTSPCSLVSAEYLFPSVFHASVFYLSNLPLSFLYCFRLSVRLPTLLGLLFSCTHRLENLWWCPIGLLTLLVCGDFWFCLFVFCRAGCWTQSLKHGRQVLYHQPSPPPPPQLFSELWHFCLDIAQI
jgi:hypothetical protein